MKPEYAPKTTEQKLGRLVEEAGEVLSAVGKAQRWGLDSVNPELPPEEQETNRDWILRELKDLSSAMGEVVVAIASSDQRFQLEELHQLNAAIAYLRVGAAGITPEERLELFSTITKGYCLACGGDCVPCNCQRDE